MRTLIIGGGLCGLALAEALATKGDDFTLIEARSRLGSRILTEHHSGAAFDLDPAWFWQGQPRIAALVNRLGRIAFEQFSTGDLLFEDPQGHVQRGHGFSSCKGSLRGSGGLRALIEVLKASLPAQKTNEEHGDHHADRNRVGHHRLALQWR